MPIMTLSLKHICLEAYLVDGGQNEKSISKNTTIYLLFDKSLRNNISFDVVAL